MSKIVEEQKKKTKNAMDCLRNYAESPNDFFVPSEFLKSFIHSYTRLVSCMKESTTLNFYELEEIIGPDTLLSSYCSSRNEKDWNKANLVKRKGKELGYELSYYKGYYFAFNE